MVTNLLAPVAGIYILADLLVEVLESGMLTAKPCAKQPLPRCANHSPCGRPHHHLSNLQARQ